MTLKGFSVPLSPEGRATLAPTPPWYYAGDLLVVDFRADPLAAAAVLPPGIEPDPDDPGRCAVFFNAFQYASANGDEPLDPVRSQYGEFILLVNGRYRGEPVAVCPYIYVDNDSALARGWIQGWPKKLGAVHTTRSFGLASPAAPLVAPGGRFGGTLSSAGRRLAEATVTLESISTDPVTLGRRQIVNVRHFPELAASRRERPAVHELVYSTFSDVRRSEVWEGPATLRFLEAPADELAALAPVSVLRGYRYSTVLCIEDLVTLEQIGV